MDHGEILANLVAITSIGEGAALQLLEATGWKLEEAVNLHYASGLATENNNMPSASNASNRPGPSTIHDDDDVRAPLPSKVDRLYGDVSAHETADRIAARFRAMHRSTVQPVDVFKNNKNVVPARPGASPASSGLSDLFKPPRDLLYSGDLNTAAQQAQKEGKWIMVNVQKASEFASHRLNRDTFSHKVLKETIKGTFLFIQLQDTSSDGQKAMANYRLNQLPVTMVLDPLTGALVYSREGFIEPEQLMEELVPFMDYKPTDPGAATIAQNVNLKRKQLAGMVGSSKGGPGVSGNGHGASRPRTEDEELAMAIAMSMEAGGAAKDQTDNGTSSYNYDEDDMGDDNDGSNDNGNDDDDDDIDEAAVWAEINKRRAAEEEAARKLSPEQVQAEAAARLPAEPSASTADTYRVALRLPDGQRIQRWFSKTDTVQVLHDWFVSSNLEAAGGKKYHLMPAAPPGSSLLLDTSQTLTDAGAAGAMLVVKWTD